MKSSRANKTNETEEKNCSARNGNENNIKLEEEDDDDEQEEVGMRHQKTPIEEKMDVHNERCLQPFVCKSFELRINTILFYIHSILIFYFHSNTMYKIYAGHGMAWHGGGKIFARKSNTKMKENL